MSREIKFRRAHFKDEAKTQFSHFSYWGVGLGGKSQPSFTSPSFNNQAIFYEDQQYTGLKDKANKEIYEGDCDEIGNSVETLNGCWCLNGDRLLYRSQFIVTNHIYEP